MADMIKKLPGYYRRSKVVSDLYSIMQAYFDKTNTDIAEADISLFITTTNNFTKHENDVGLNNSGDTAKNRRSQVIARLQGNNLLSRSELETLISNYEKSGCSIDEDFPNYTVYITFSGRARNGHHRGTVFPERVFLNRPGLKDRTGHVIPRVDQVNGQGFPETMIHNPVIEGLVRAVRLYSVQVRHILNRSAQKVACIQRKGALVFGPDIDSDPDIGAILYRFREGQDSMLSLNGWRTGKRGDGCL